MIGISVLNGKESQIFNKKHGEKYDYSKVKYIDSKTHVTIICKIHGEFYQSPGKHLLGRGCQICGGTKRTKDSFIEEAKKSFNERLQKINWEK